MWQCLRKVIMVFLGYDYIPRLFLNAFNLHKRYKDLKSVWGQQNHPLSHG